MKATSKVIMGATLVMVVSLAIVLGLVLVLLAELYCTLLLRRRQLTSSDTTTTTAATAATSLPTTTSSSQHQPLHDQSPNSLSLTAFYSQGVLQAPRSFLFPSISCKENKATETKNQHSRLHHILEVHTQESITSPQQISLMNASPPPNSFSPLSHQINTEIQIQRSSSGGTDKACGRGETFVYISNPIYDNDASRPSRVDMDTPFETPDSSPSRLGADGLSSGDEEIAQPSPSSPHSYSPVTPPLSPMKKLPAEACSVSLRDARSLGTPGSDSVSNNGLSSSSSSGSPCTSPSW